MKECFHFTKDRFLKSILENGLQPNYGANCSIIGDGKGEKISYSVGTEQATKMFEGLYGIYCRIADGRVNEAGFDERGKQAIAELQNATDFEDWEEPGVYLTFDGECISDLNMDESKPYDSYTHDSIPPEQLKVCVIRNKETGEIISSKYDIVSFWIARDKNHTFGFYDLQYADRIAEFEAEKYEMDYIGLDLFCEMFPEKLEESKEADEMSLPGEDEKEVIPSEELLPQIAETKNSNIGLSRIVGLIEKIKSKFQKVFNKDAALGRESDGGVIDAPASNDGHTQSESFVDRLRRDNKTIKQTATEIGTGDDCTEKRKAIAPLAQDEI